MDQTARLALPFIMPSQAQKHITHTRPSRRLTPWCSRWWKAGY